ncbi:MAG: hypothetical protein ACREJR_00410 [Candidatus Rokuibacteriota bacterium]
MSKPPGTRQETLIREVNERIREVSAGQDRFDVLCECGDLDCHERLDVSAAEYEEVRGENRTFLVAPGHAVAGTGLVRERPTHLVVALAASGSELVA